MTDAKRRLKAKALREFTRFATMFAYLWVMFFLLQLHQYVILAQRHIPFEQYGVGLINALVLAKVMLVADDLRLGEWRGRRPLIFPVLLRSILFAIVFIIFDIIEKMLIGVWHGKTVADSIETFGGGGIDGRPTHRVLMSISTEYPAAGENRERRDKVQLARLSRRRSKTFFSDHFLKATLRLFYVSQKRKRKAITIARSASLAKNRVERQRWKCGAAIWVCSRLSL